MLALVLCLVGATDQYDLPTVPAYFWSGMPSVFANNAVVDYVSVSSVWDTLGHLAGGGNKFASSLIAASEVKPEVVVAFTYDSLRADEVASASELSVFKEAIASAPSSLAVPYVVMDADGGVPGCHRVCCASALAYLRESGVLSDGETDLLMVDVDSASKWNGETISGVLDAVREGTEGKYVAMLTANKTTPTDLVLEFAPPPKENAATWNRRRLNYIKEQDTRQLPLTPGILTGLLVGLLLFTIFINGFCCLFNLQTPRKFEHE